MCRLAAELTRSDALTCLDLSSLATKSTCLDLFAPVVDLLALAAKLTHLGLVGSGSQVKPLDFSAPGTKQPV